MYFFNIPREKLPQDADYYFNVVVVNIAIRETLQKDSKNCIEECWDISRITSARPVVFHIYIEFEEAFIDDENYFLDIYDHSVVQVSSKGIEFYDMLEEEDDEEQQEESDEGTCELFDDPEDLWR